MCWVRQSTSCGSRARCAGGLALLLLLCACQSTPVHTVPAVGRAPILQRLQQTYPELAGGHFVSLADFEDHEQAGLFRIVDAHRAAAANQPTLSILRSRAETGAASLKAELQSPEQRLLFDGRRSPHLALVRDWSDYTLLLMGLYGTRGDEVVQFAIESGGEREREWHQTVRLAPGWNVYRFDLATVGTQIDIRDIRALSWQAVPGSGPIEFYIDDVLLADNTTVLLNATPTPGELYARTRGRRLVIGAGARFELDFADGVLTAWRGSDGAELADIFGFGPWPVPLATGWSGPDAPPVRVDDPTLYAGWGTTAAATQRIIELTPFRAVIEGVWRYTGAPATDLAPVTLPSHTWRYTVYPDGRMYVLVRSTAPSTGWGQPRVGYAIGLSGARAFRLYRPATSATAGNATEFVLLSQPGAAQADLVWTWPAAQVLPRCTEVGSADERRRAIIVGDVPAEAVVTTAHYFNIWPTDIDALPEATALAADYREPAQLNVTTGSLVTQIRGDLDANGFNEAEGVYELTHLDGVLRAEFRPGTFLRFAPQFRLHDTDDRTCWIYAQGHPVADTAQDADGQLLFRLPRVGETPVLLETHCAAGAQTE